jgi:RHS repeat-associated protein
MDWADPTHDRAGNMTSGPKPGEGATRQHYVWDAWNRLVAVKADNAGVPGTTIAEFQYDGQHHRIVKLVPNAVTPANWDRTDFYENGGWQEIEERFAANLTSKTVVATAVQSQYIYDLRYIDAVAVRDRDADGNGSLEERLFYCHNSQFSVNGLINTTGTVVERYVYDPYGKITILDAQGVPKTDPTYSSLGNGYTYTGRFLDRETGLHYFRYRNYDQSLGRFIGRDKIGYHDGLNLYGAYFVPQSWDPYGLKHPRLDDVIGGQPLPPLLIRPYEPPDPHYPPPPPNMNYPPGPVSPDTSIASLLQSWLSGFASNEMYFFDDHPALQNLLQNVEVSDTLGRMKGYAMANIWADCILHCKAEYSDHETRSAEWEELKKEFPENLEYPILGWQGPPTINFLGTFEMFFTARAEAKDCCKGSTEYVFWVENNWTFSSLTRIPETGGFPINISSGPMKNTKQVFVHRGLLEFPRVRHCK